MIHSKIKDTTQRDIGYICNMFLLINVRSVLKNETLLAIVNYYPSLVVNTYLTFPVKRNSFFISR